jgi:membrane-associated phospholipid phosphatase
MPTSIKAGPRPPAIAVYLKETWGDIRTLAQDALGLACGHRKVLGGGLLCVLLAVLALWPHEMSLLGAIQAMGADHKSLRVAAKRISHWGDIHTGSLILFGLLWLTGFLARKDRLRTAAAACFLAALSAGLFGDVFRYGLGRARPNSGYADGFYGFQVNPRFHGFPSGHTTTAFGTMVPLAVMFPQVALPSLAAAAAVGWSRLYLNWHRPADVLAGAAVGISFGTLVGVAARRRLRRAEKTEAELVAASLELVPAEPIDKL